MSATLVWRMCDSDSPLGRPWWVTARPERLVGLFLKSVCMMLLAG